MSLLKRRRVFSVWLRKQRAASTCKTLSKQNKWALPSGYETNISVFNCITNSNVPLILKNPNLVAWYMCGPTVYDSAHLGHACCYMKFDTINRILLNYFNINVVMMMGVTDIDDKIIIRAAQLKEEPRRLAERYEMEFFEDMASLNIMPPTVVTKVTNFIPQIINFVQKIIDKGQAYNTEDGSVYFDTKSYTQYGKLLPNIPREDSSVTYKRSAMDFALWKGSKPGEPCWPSPWGPGAGRPGWHIECSTMASDILGSNIDIHSGGVDLLFPHHENEEAQSCVYHGVGQWVNYWLHSGMEYTDTAMKNAVAIMKKIESFLTDCDAYVNGYTALGDINESYLLKAISDVKTKLLEALSDDFDTATAMSAITELVGVTNKMLHQKCEHDTESARSPLAIAAVASFIQQSLEKFGIDFSNRKESSMQTKDHGLYLGKILDRVVQFRNQVRHNALNPSGEDTNAQADNVKKRGVKNTALLNACDTLRDDLLTSGICIKDHGKMSTWNYVDKNVKEKT
ncbi:probable cysteine--tRNA ligase, mitochondrial isoform X2 [Cryptotermes secundus]|uniref:probable cysteine--tRNA ligase, mitochondrial isoform X2 n=1 Tax=Cryptotermes secundus TaxID=105785 RepID=UPI000CD7BB27|nr:probable cysteine--tRNA ligase, mitochondrial isoform X2 [Cryptotermes secundus]